MKDLVQLQQRTAWLPIGWTAVLFTHAVLSKDDLMMSPVELTLWVGLTLIVLGPYLTLEAQERWVKNLGHALSVAAILCIVGAGYRILIQPGISTSTPASSLFEESPTKREMVTISAEELMRMCATHTDVQTEQLLKSYLGKWMTIKGTVIEVSEPSASGDVRVTTFDSDEHMPVTGILTFNDGSADQAVSIDKGDKIVVIGQLQTVKSYYYALTNCELRADRKAN